MSASELMERFEQAQREGLGDELLEVTPEQAERLHALVDEHATSARVATARVTDGRFYSIQG